MVRVVFFLALIFLGGCKKADKESQPALDERESVVLKKYYDDGKIQFEIELVDSIPNGRAIHYYPNGGIKTKGNYANGVLEGPSINYYDNGQVMSLLLFSNGSLNGESVYYYDNGNIQYEGKFYNGQRVGIHHEYFKEEKDQIKCRKEYVIVKSESVLNTSIYYDVKGRIVNKTPTLKLKEYDGYLSIEINDREFDSVQAVIGDYDLFFNLKGTLDTLKSQTNSFIEIPFNSGDTIRGYVENFEWLNRDQSISKDIFFSYPNVW